MNNPTLRKSIKIFAIDPGTKEMGVALLDNGELVYQTVKSFEGNKSSNETLQAIRSTIIRYIADFKPDILAVEKTYFSNSRNGDLLNGLSDEIQAIGKRRKLKVIALAANTVRKIICNDGFASKGETARAVVNHYPVLKVFLHQNRRWKEKYHANMYDAVALALAVNHLSLMVEGKRNR